MVPAQSLPWQSPWLPWSLTSLPPALSWPSWLQGPALERLLHACQGRFPHLQVRAALLLMRVFAFSWRASPLAGASALAHTLGFLKARSWRTVCQQRPLCSG